MTIFIVIAVVVLIVLFVIVSYNSIVRLRNQVDNGWAQIDVQIKRRADLIPNLVETVKGYAAHESGTFEAVVQARDMSLQAESPAEAAAAEGPIAAALGKLFALAEAYPDLKADANFRQLQTEITGTEDRIAFARQFYNDSVTRFHNKVDAFPGVLIVKLGSFPHRELFEADDSDRALPKVQF
ncbi:MAG: LemA family protein [Acidimicrobiales bacterium]